MLQELVTPVVIFRWPKKAEKVAAVLTPIAEITSLKPRVEVRAGVGQPTPFGADTRMTARQVVVKVVEPASGRRLFRSQRHKVEAEGQPVTISLEREPNEAPWRPPARRGARCRQRRAARPLRRRAQGRPQGVGLAMNGSEQNRELPLDEVPVDDLDRKLLDVFAGRVVRKDRVK